MKPNKIVFFDIDHTIYDPVLNKIPESTVEAIEKLAARQDTILGIATGRALYMLDIIACIKQHIDVYITINGQIITAKDQILFDLPMDNRIITEVKAAFIRHDLVYGFIGRDNQGISRLDDDAITMFAAAKMPLPDEDPAFDKKQTVYQMWAFADKTQFDMLAKDIEKYQLVPWLSDGFDVVMTGRSKKDGVEFVLDHYGIPLENAYAFGDGANDIEMIAHVPNGVAMGNSKQAVKDVAKHVTTDFDKDGIKNALIHMNLIK